MDRSWEVGALPLFRVALISVAISFVGSQVAAAHDETLKDILAPAPIVEPFGIAKGTPLSTLKTKGKPNDNEYSLVSVPSPHPLLSRYSVTATKEAGVCAVSGYAPANSSHSIDWIVETIQKQIAELLGQPMHMPFGSDPAIKGIWLWGVYKRPLKSVSVRSERAPMNRLTGLEAVTRRPRLKLRISNTPRHHSPTWSKTVKNVGGNREKSSDSLGVNLP